MHRDGHARRRMMRRLPGIGLEPVEKRRLRPGGARREETGRDLSSPSVAAAYSNRIQTTDRASRAPMLRLNRRSAAGEVRMRATPMPSSVQTVADGTLTTVKIAAIVS